MRGRVFPLSQISGVGVTRRAMQLLRGQAHSLLDSPFPKRESGAGEGVHPIEMEDREPGVEPCDARYETADDPHAQACAIEDGGLGRVVRGSRGLLFGLLGVVSVALGAIGAVLPVMPTTVFLIAACWCFARSNPVLEQRLVRNRFFGPFLGFLDSGSGMPMRAKVVSLLMMWSAIGVSGVLLTLRGVPLVAVLGTAALGVVGTWMILRVPTAPSRGSREGATDPFEGVIDRA